MVSSSRRTCPSCHSHLSPLAAECPECGLTLAPPRQGRPLLFQASALAQAAFEAPQRTLTAPALGRVAPVAVEVSPEELVRPEEALPSPPEPAAWPALDTQESAASFWPLVKVEAAEALLLALVQLLALGLPAWLLGIGPRRLFEGAWLLVVPYLLAVSWMLFMGPLVLTGRSP